MRRQFSTLCLVAVCSMVLGSTLIASAKEARRPAQSVTDKDAGSSTPLTVKRLAFTDSGKVVPVGSMKNYVNDSTTLNRPIYQTFSPDSFGSSLIPSRFSPANGPLIRF